MAVIRLADPNDIDALAQMRWDYSVEETGTQGLDREEFHRTCTGFLEKALGSGNWFIWVAEAEGRLVSHMYLQLIHKVPRPGKSPDPYFGYVTNVYTRPDYRSRGLGGQIHQAMERWSKEHEVEFLVLWPSEASGAFYERHGFVSSREALEKHWE
ncbi:GNAT family N-acetyltransferase [Paenibacillus sp. CC-CFT747]|nr:GNAT family N-acetyltransferase [Paenibacillus sp. CC-CFT747]